MADPSTPSYAQWVRHALARQQRNPHGGISLFDSSVPEPIELLRPIIAEAFADPVSDRYVSAFLGGNRFAIDAIAARYDANASDILGTTGATAAVGLVYRALVAPGERVLIETPGFDMFGTLAEDRGAVVDTFARVGESFALDLAAIERGLRPDTKLVVLSNLHNPSGMPIGRETLERLSHLLAPRGVRAIVDEVYADYAGGNHGAAPAAMISPVFISVSSLTKIFGLSTLRCGWIIAAPDVMPRIRDSSDRSELGISNVSHAVAALVLERASAFTAYWQAILAQSRPVIAERLADWTRRGLVEGEMPAHGCIVFPRLVGVDDSAAFADRLLERSGVIVAPGAFFGAPDRIRIGFGRDAASLARGLDHVEDALLAFRRRFVKIAATG